LSIILLYVYVTGIILLFVFVIMMINIPFVEFRKVSYVYSIF